MSKLPRAPGSAGLMVYAMGCTWHDYIENAGSKQVRDRLSAGTLAPGLPVCPHCGSPLMQMPVKDWDDSIAFAEKHRPGWAAYRAWSRGKCHRTLAHSMSEWCQAMLKPITKAERGDAP